VEFVIFTVGVSNYNSKDNKEDNSENDLTFTKHIVTFMQT